MEMPLAPSFEKGLVAIPNPFLLAGFAQVNITLIFVIQLLNYRVCKGN